jgi:hypothetical protein
MRDRFIPSLRRSTGLGPAQSPPPGALVMQPSMASLSRTSLTMRSQASRAIVFSCAALIHSSRRSRIVVAPQAQSAMAA